MQTNLVNLDDIAILIAVPLSKDDFLRRVRESDWLSKFLDPTLDVQSLNRSLDERWAKEYFPLVAEPLLNLVDVARGLGAEVKTHVRLGDITEMSTNKGVIIIFAHWKGAEVTYDDISGSMNVQKFIDKAKASDTSIARWIVSHLDRQGSRKVRLDDVLNDSLICELPHHAESDSPIVLEDNISRSSTRRDEIDTIFHGLLRPGNRLEFFDGLHDKVAVASAISPSFVGVLDLSACNSMVLGTYLAGRGHNRFRTVQFPKVVDFLWAATVVKGTLSLMAKGGFDYQEARLTATQLLDVAVREATATA
jgi:hypothetical protein